MTDIDPSHGGRASIGATEPRGTDNRAIHRIPVRLAVSQRGRSAPLGRTRDISLEGVFLETSAPFGVGAVVPLSLDLTAGGPPLEGRAEVVRVTPDGMGLRFIDLDRDTAKRLKRWIVDLTSVQGTQRQVEQLHDERRTVEPIASPDRVLAVLERIRAARHRVTLVPPDRVARDYARVVEIGDGVVFETVDASTMRVGEEVFGLVNVDFVSFSFSLPVRAVDGAVVRCDLPALVVHSERRARERAPLVGAHIRWPSPWSPDIWLTLPVIERGGDGLSFRAPVEGCLLAPGSPLVGAEVVVGDRVEPLESAEVRHVTAIDSADGRRSLRVGVSYGVRRRALVAVERAPRAAPTRGALGWLRAHMIKLRTIISYGLHKGRRRLTSGGGTSHRRVTIANGALELVGLFDQSYALDERARCPLVIVVPGFAGRKEQFSFLAGTLIEGFRQQHRDVAVLRVDTSNNLGESGRDPGCEGEGRQALHYTLSGVVDDIFACLAWARDNPHVDPTHVVLVSSSMASIPVRHALTRPEAAEVGLWVSYMGAADAIDTVRNVSGNTDLHAYWQRGERLGIVSLNGVLTDGDRFWEDMTRLGLGPLEVARDEMTRVRADVVWVRGVHDAFMDPRRIRQLIEAPADGARSLVEVESGHIPRTGDEAVSHFVLITQHIWRHVHGSQLAPFRPSLGRLAADAAAEWQRVGRKRLRDKVAWWRDYLLDAHGLGFDILELAPPYSDFMDLQAELLAPAGAEVLDLGAGTGNLTTRILAAGAARCVAVDLVPEALARLRAKLPDEPRLETVVADLAGSPALAIRRWLAGDLASPQRLASRLPGVHRGALDRLLAADDDGVHAALRGREVDLAALAARARLPDNAAALAVELNTVMRVARGRLSPAAAASTLRALPADLFDAPTGLPFPDASFDAVSMSLLLSYLGHPEDCLFEAARVLRPGGRLVVSSMVVDADSSKLYLDLVARCERLEDAAIPAGQSRESLLASAREFVAHAAELFRIEEEGLFRFYDADALVRLVVERGFVEPRVTRSFGAPPQAVIVTCVKP